MRSIISTALVAALVAAGCGGMSEPDPIGPDAGAVAPDAAQGDACAKWLWMEDPAMWDCSRLEPDARVVPAGQCDVLLSEQNGGCTLKCNQWFWASEAQIIADQTARSFVFHQEPNSELGYTCAQRR